MESEDLNIFSNLEEFTNLREKFKPESTVPVEDDLDLEKEFELKGPKMKKPQRTILKPQINEATEESTENAKPIKESEKSPGDSAKATAAQVMCEVEQYMTDVSDAIDCIEIVGTKTRAQTRSMRSKEAESAQEPSTNLIPAESVIEIPNSQPRRRGRLTRRELEQAIARQSNSLAEFVQQCAQEIVPRNQPRGNNARARRDYIAEIAARAQNVGYVNLVDPPIPRVEGYITIDSDDEEKSSDVNIASGIIESEVFNNSFDEENPEISIKINWNGKVELYKLRKYQKFSHIIEQIAKREGTAVEHIALNLDSRFISSNDCPHSINYKLYNFITGRILSDSKRIVTPKKRKPTKGKVFMLKVQSDKWKRPLQIELQKCDKFKVLYIKCAEELNLQPSDIKLSFDGELLDVNTTPEDLILDGGEAIDLHFK